MVFFLPTMLPTTATFGVVHSIIELKLPLFYCYVILCTYVENRWFEEKWVLMHLHFDRDEQKWKSKKRKSKKPKNFFLNVVANFNLFIYNVFMIL